jgi:hypothetical protein
VHTDAGQRVQGTERLVEEEEFGLADEGAGQRGPLGLASRDGGGPGAFMRGEADLGEGGAAALVGAVPGEADHHVVEHPFPGLEPWVLKDHGAAPRHQQLPADLRVEPRHGTQQRGLAGAAAAEQGDELALADGEIDSGKHLAAVEGTAYSLCDGHHWPPSKPRRQDSRRRSRSRTMPSAASPSAP